MVKTKTNPLAYLFLFLALCLIALALLHAVSTLPPLNGHARQRHQENAERAYQYVQALTPEQADHCKWSCTDGRDRYVCGMPGGEWAIVVLDGANLVTAFVTDQDYAKKIIDDWGDSCNHWHYAHP